jgi:transposase-like protein
MTKRAKRKPAGRPSKLTPELQRRVVEGIELGMPLEHAAMAVGIGESTLHRWVQQGGEEAGAYREFREAVREARARRTKKLLKHVWRAMEDKASSSGLQRGDWKAAWKALETLEPKDFGLKVRVQVVEELDGLLEELERVLPVEWYEKVLEVASRRAGGEEVGEAPLVEAVAAGVAASAG